MGTENAEPSLYAAKGADPLAVDRDHAARRDVGKVALGKVVVGVVVQHHESMAV